MLLCNKTWLAGNALLPFVSPLFFF